MMGRLRGERRNGCRLNAVSSPICRVLALSDHDSFCGSWIPPTVCSPRAPLHPLAQSLPLSRKDGLRGSVSGCGVTHGASKKKIKNKKVEAVERRGKMWGDFTPQNPSLWLQPYFSLHWKKKRLKRWKWMVLRTFSKTCWYYLKRYPVNVGTLTSRRRLLLSWNTKWAAEISANQDDLPLRQVFGETVIFFFFF